MTPDLRAKLDALGRELTPELLGGTSQIFGHLFQGMDPQTIEEPNVAYGPDERHQLDIYRKQISEDAPVFVFVHGGGFVMGDKRSDLSPFYRNVGDFAARRGWIGVTITYRFAPQHKWPSGPEDLGRLVRWLKAHISEYGGDPDRIVLCGQSAGAVHVAGYLSHGAHHAAPGGGIAGAVLMSGVYDTEATTRNEMRRAYYGDEASTYADASCVAGLLETQVPLLFTVSEFDPPEFQSEAARLAGKWGETKRAFPEMHYLAGHNHLSPAQSLGTPHKEVEELVGEFVRRVTE